MLLWHNEIMKILSAKYLTSVVDEDKILKDEMKEIAFVGRSNVGKSSLINALLGQKNLAKTSSTPGLTKMINYFLVEFVSQQNLVKKENSIVNDETKEENCENCADLKKTEKNRYAKFVRVVDLPGYGYAKTGQKHIANWAGLMEKYLTLSPNLVTVFVLVDCRHTPSELDKMMLDFLNAYQIPYIVIATKVDKLAKSKIPQACTAIAKTLGIRREIIMPFSSENFFGKTQLLEYIETVAEN